LLEFIDYGARSFDCGEYASAQDAPCGKFGVEDFSTSIAVFGETGRSFRCITTRQKNEKFEDSIADFAD
jgi:hypothetical protein